MLRARMKISQAELAHGVGISRQTCSLIETGKQKMTWVTFMAMIAFFEGNPRTKKALAELGLLADAPVKPIAAKSTKERNIIYGNN